MPGPAVEVKTISPDHPIWSYVQEYYNQDPKTWYTLSQGQYKEIENRVLNEEYDVRYVIVSPDQKYAAFYPWKTEPFSLMSGYYPIHILNFETNDIDYIQSLDEWDNGSGPNGTSLRPFS